VHQLISYFKEAYDSLRRKIFYNTVTELFIHVKLVVLPKNMSEWKFVFELWNSEHIYV